MLGNIYIVGKLPVSVPKVGANGCSIVSGCSGVELVEVLGLTVWMGVLCLLVIGTLSSIPAAQTLVANERRKTSDELRAFDTFIERVKSLSPTTPSTSPDGVHLRAEQPQDGDGINRVQQAYRETIMATQHYSDEYDESLSTNLRNEFSDEIAVAVTESDGFTPQLKQALIQKGINSREEREALLQAIDAEADTLKTARQSLRQHIRQCKTIRSQQFEARPYNELISAWQRLDALERECIDCLNNRQQSIHDGYPVGYRRLSSEMFHAYLYKDLDVTYPVLVDGTRVIEHIQDAKREITRLITRRV
ncbi:DUF7260 family protein [Halegenticoccus tardaugens]|uniref:DUF7260 family protein n=1 Tax=Halegenticoccus tardaugens TaxID=2071624 RepID=UPI00100AB1E6|nr:hypothetical protein [Halegenticoccus tardaugens]